MEIRPLISRIYKFSVRIN